MDLETTYRQARRELDELHKVYRFAEFYPKEMKLVPKEIRDERRRLSILVQEMAVMRWERIPEPDRINLVPMIGKAKEKAKAKHG